MKIILEALHYANILLNQLIPSVFTYCNFLISIIEVGCHCLLLKCFGTSQVHKPFLNSFCIVPRIWQPETFLEAFPFKGSLSLSFIDM